MSSDIPSADGLTYTIPHDEVVVTVDGEYGDDVAPMEDVSVYLFTPGSVYLSQSRITDDQGTVIFSLPKKDYRVRVDYLSQQYWSELSNWSDKTVIIPEGIAEVHIVRTGEPLSNVDVYLFNSAGSYLNIHQSTDSSGIGVLKY